MRLEISRAALEGILAEATASPDVEVCGLLLGDGMHVDRAVSCRNLADDPATSFEIDPQTLIAAHRAARAGGPAVIGHYHSHPTGQVEPSARDAAVARRGEVWLIVGDDDVRAWLALDGGAFDRLDLPSSSRP